MLALHRVDKARGRRNVTSSNGMPAMSWVGINTSATRTVAQNIATTMQAIRIINLKRLGSCIDALFIVFPFLVCFFLLVDHLLPDTA